MGVPPIGKEETMKTLVRMKSTQFGKDDDTALTVKYNEGCETRIGPELLKAFESRNAVEILKEKKEEQHKIISSPKLDPSSENSDSGDSGDLDEDPSSEDADEPHEEPKKQKGGKKKNK